MPCSEKGEELEKNEKKILGTCNATLCSNKEKDVKKRKA